MGPGWIDRIACVPALDMGRGAYSSAMHRYDGPGEGPDPLIARLPHQARNEHARVIVVQDTALWL